MVKLRTISFILCLLMVMQMLPMAQIGKALFQNQWTEELPHSIDENGKGDTVKFPQSFMPPSAHSVYLAGFRESGTLYIHLSEQIPTNHSTDVIYPPPDDRLMIYYHN